MYSYKPLKNKLKEFGLTKSDLTTKLGISSRTIAKISKGEKIANNVIFKIANFLHCKTDDLFREVCDNHILQILREEKEAKISGGLYHELQVRMTYNSNHIEGSKLTEYQTRLIFETSNHFRAIDYVIDKALEPLSEDIIKHLHLLLKQGTKDSSLDWFAVGDYKKRANTVGGRETCKPSEVHKAMDKLVTDFNSKSNHRRYY